jgi:hypothetical protein
MSFLVRTAVAVAVLSASSIAADAATDVDEHRRVVEAFFEDSRVTNQEHSDLALEVLRATRNEAVSLEFRGDPIVLKPTELRVRGHNPPCGDGLDPPSQLSRTLSDVGRVFNDFAYISLPLDPTGGVFAVSVTVGMFFRLVGGFAGQKSYQSTGNCSLACTAVSGHYDPDKLKSILTVRYNYQRTPSSPPRSIAPGDDGDWFVVSDWTSQAIELKMTKATSGEALARVIMKQGQRDFGASTSEVLSCPATLVCTQAKNWSSNLTRTLSVVASIDVNQVPAGSCIDSSMIERDKHEGELAERLPKEFIARYYDELKGRTVRRLATPRK